MSRFGFFLLVIAFSTSGCSPSDRPPTYPVTGGVKIKGKAIEDAMIVFVPTDSQGRAATARTDAGGNFKMGTFDQGDGVVSGSYKVKVSKYEGLEPAGGETVYMDADAESKIYNPDDKQFKLRLPKNILPKKYEDENTSGFAITVGTAAATLDLLLD
jgi:hypothetical protein